MTEIDFMKQGFEYFPNFLTPEDEANILKVIDQNSDQWHYMGVGTNQRAMQSYGFNYTKGSQGLNITTPIPEELMPLIMKINSMMFGVGDTDRQFNQMTVNRYLPGQGIDPHWDHPTRFGDKILGLTLGSGATMVFEQPKNKLTVDVDDSPTSSARFEKYLEPCSLYLMRDSIRYSWRHGIRRVHHDLVGDQTIARGIRTSLTFRTCQLEQVL